MNAKRETHGTSKRHRVRERVRDRELERKKFSFFFLLFLINYQQEKNNHQI